MDNYFKSGDTVFNLLTDEYLIVIGTRVKDEYKDFIICTNGKVTKPYRVDELVSIKDFRSIKISQLLVK